MSGETVSVNLWMVLPFGILLFFIAVGPVLFHAWWERHYAKTATLLGLVTICYYLIGLHAGHRMLLVGRDYLSFIALIGSLYVVAGGIHINVKGEATPFANVVFLFVGALLANVLGTTGASMLLIRPWLRMNKYRVTGHHVVFFIFIVSNVGGCLTPIGDPPLFLGYILGVPFWWVTRHCLPMWGVAIGLLLAMFFVVDQRNYLRAPKPIRVEQTAREEWRFEGLGNIGFLAVILAAVFIENPPVLREGLMLAAAASSYFLTRKEVHEANHFHFRPIREVAFLFIGIFATMLPAMDWIGEHGNVLHEAGASALFWSCGLLSSGLDNAPTYLCFLKAISVHFAGPEIAGNNGAIASLLSNAEGNRALAAISVGAVFFGANTYIGNGPNFMVKAIADHQKVHTPGFAGYLCRFALPFMGPVLLLVWWLFFWR